MTPLNNYLSKKIEAEKIRRRALKKGLDPDKVYHFEPDPLAEEGIELLYELAKKENEIKELRRELMLAEFDIEAEKRNVAYLKRWDGNDRRRSRERELVGST